jgi:hypothetical protein
MRIKTELARGRIENDRFIPLAGWSPANTLLAQFVQLLCVMFSQVAQYTHDTTGTTQAPGAAADRLSVAGPAANTNLGIFIGTGNTPVTLTDYMLETRVTANITHGITSFVVENPDASTWRVTIIRTFLNLTGAPIDITEVGLYTYSGTAPQGPYCLDRSLYSFSLAINAQEILAYRFTITL